MLKILNFYKDPEIRELISLKTSTLAESKQFLQTVKGHKCAWFLEDDIALCIQEIADLKSKLVFSVY